MLIAQHQLFFSPTRDRRAIFIPSPSPSRTAIVMAFLGVARPMASFGAGANAALGLRSAALRRGFASAPKAQQLARNQQRATGTVRIPRQSLQQSLRRGYASEVSPETQRVVKRRGWSFFRWAWRLTYLSAIGGFAWMCYGIYQNRTPADQEDPDPRKKTLVVLGMCSPQALPYTKETRLARYTDCIISRHRVGLSLAPQEARYRELQCRCHLAP